MLTCLGPGCSCWSSPQYCVPVVKLGSVIFEAVSTPSVHLSCQSGSVACSTGPMSRANSAPDLKTLLFQSDVCVGCVQLVECRLYNFCSFHYETSLLAFYLQVRRIFCAASIRSNLVAAVYRRLHFTEKNRWLLPLPHHSHHLILSEI